MDRTMPTTFSILAANLPEHARYPIHTDAGARAAGFPRALVAGVTTYAYLTHPVAAAWGLPWLASGGGEVVFRRPVFDGDLVACTPTLDADDPDVATIGAVVGGDARPRVSFRAVVEADPPSPMRAGAQLRSRRVALIGELGDEYGSRAGDPLDLYTAHHVVHPAVWPAIANHVVHVDVARGSWIHTRSIIRHHALAPVGAEAEVHAVVVRRFDAHGERAVLDVRIEVDGVPVATLEHEAIVALPDS